MAPTHRNQPTEWTNAGRLLPAMILIGIGVLFLLNNIHIVEVRHWTAYWPVILIAIGLVKLVDSDYSTGKIGGGIVIAVGGLFLARNLGYIDLRFRDLWPLFLIGAGLLMLWNRIPWSLPARPGVVGAPENIVNEYAVFGGGKRTITTQDFQGGQVTAMFGGVELNLRKALIAGDSATIEVNILCGGVEIKIPENWSVVLEAGTVFGGYSDETTQPPADLPGLKRLIVKGSTMFGGIEVKN